MNKISDFFILFNPLFIYIVYSAVFKLTEDISEHYKKDFFIFFFTFFQILEVVKCCLFSFVQ